MERKNAWKSYSKSDVKKLEELCEGYKDYLFKGKTEREGTKYIIEKAKAAGYTSLDEAISKKKKLKAGDKIYAVCMGKTVALFNIGKKNLEDGMNILGAHLDSPRLDVKQNPLYESNDLAYLDTHYYGGIKKYQWVTLPLAIHGVVAKTDGTTVDIVIGEDDDDPVFCVTDILIHLAQEQMGKKANVAVEGENLDLLIGSQPLKIKSSDADKNKKDLVKQKVLEILSDKYGMAEEDFISAELEIVPAGKPRDMGLDKSMIIAYGQDDKVCAYTSLVAQLAVKNPEKTSCTLLVDKEEIGSVGATGMQSKFFENCVAEILELAGYNSNLSLRRCLQNSSMLSSDVSAGYDPLYASCFESKNAAFLGRGMVFNKFTGARGKSGSNDANAEYIGRLRGILEKNKVFYQTAELGKVDVGGGGTIAYILSLYGMEVIDCGVAVLNMHAPWEVTSKADIFETEKGYEAFLKEA
ncbi:Aspartyl aminopeptidase [Lachnospiraceae bacterium NE2001]|nr:Aspartyl aminopeptidase [Lachnospiraceae bacterium NE2001]